MKKNINFKVAPLSASALVLTWLVLVLLQLNFLEGKKPPKKPQEYKEIQKASADTPPGAVHLKEAIDWNYDLRWNDMMQWDVQYSDCWHSGDLSKYFNSSIYKKWETCRLTAAHLNAKLPPSEHHFKTATCGYIKCALHWYGWVNDDFTYNEARGENISKDLLHGLPAFFFSKLMQEYRKCSKLYKHPMDEWCLNNRPFARCHIQAFNSVCDINIDRRLPYPRPPAEWMKLKQKTRQARQIPFKGEVDETENENRGIIVRKLELEGDSSLIQLESMRPKRDVKYVHRRHKITKRLTKSHWLTTSHFCTDICMSACAINDTLYTR